MWIAFSKRAASPSISLDVRTMSARPIAASRFVAGIGSLPSAKVLRCAHLSPGRSSVSTYRTVAPRCARSDPQAPMAYRPPSSATVMSSRGACSFLSTERLRCRLSPGLESTSKSHSWHRGSVAFGRHDRAGPSQFPRRCPWRHAHASPC